MPCFGRGAGSRPTIEPPLDRGPGNLANVEDRLQSCQYLSAVVRRVLVAEQEKAEADTQETARGVDAGSRGTDAASAATNLAAIAEVAVVATAEITQAALKRALQVQRRDEARHTTLYVHRVISSVLSGDQWSAQSAQRKRNMSWGTEMKAELGDYKPGYALAGRGSTTCLGRCRAGHALVCRPPKADGWACDGRFEDDGCRSNITDYHQSDIMPRWECRICDYDLCEKCYARLLCHVPDLKVEEDPEAPEVDSGEDSPSQPLIAHTESAPWLPPHLRWLQDIDDEGFDNLTRNPYVSESSQEEAREPLGKSQTFFGSIAPVSTKKIAEAAKVAGDDASVQGNVDEDNLDAPPPAKTKRRFSLGATPVYFKSNSRRVSTPGLFGSNAGKSAGSTPVTAFGDGEQPHWSSDHSSRSSNAVKEISRAFRSSITRLLPQRQSTLGEQALIFGGSDPQVVRRRGSWG